MTYQSQSFFTICAIASASIGLIASTVCAQDGQLQATSHAMHRQSQVMQNDSTTKASSNMTQHNASKATLQSTDTPPAGISFLELEIDGRTYPYAVYRSSFLDEQTPPPMIVFLHGLGECGTDGTRQLAVGLGPAVMLDSARWPAVILFPQKPDGNSAWEDHADAVLAMIDQTVEMHGVNPTRIALTGMSQGGHGSFVIGARHADRFCAVAPICGYVGWSEFDRSKGEWNPDWVTDPAHPAVQEIAQGLANTPIWALHGDADTVVPISQSALAIEAIRAHRAKAQPNSTDATEAVRFTTLRGVDHNAWDPAYRNERLAEWLLLDRTKEAE
jgi:predicted peptidase